MVHSEKITFSIVLGDAKGLIQAAWLSRVSCARCDRQSTLGTGTL